MLLLRLIFLLPWRAIFGGARLLARREIFTRLAWRFLLLMARSIACLPRSCAGLSRRGVCLRSRGNDQQGGRDCKCCDTHMRLLRSPGLIRRDNCMVVSFVPDVGSLETPDDRPPGAFMPLFSNDPISIEHRPQS